MSKTYEDRQEELNAQMKKVEAFKKKHKRVIETPFASPDHVSEIVNAATVRVGTLNVDWFVLTSNGWSTGDIIRHNKDVEDSEKIRQYLYIGIADHVSASDYDDFSYDIDVMKLENLTL
jgi:hypothetical protein